MVTTSGHGKESERSILKWERQKRGWWARGERVQAGPCSSSFPMGRAVSTRMGLSNAICLYITSLRRRGPPGG
jgi:hypothetical protein